MAYRSDGKAQLTLPLLSGFNLPIQSGTFPGEPARPYRQAGVFQAIQTGIDGSPKISSAVGSVTATVTGTLRDREILDHDRGGPLRNLFPEVDPWRSIRENFSPC